LLELILITVGESEAAYAAEHWRDGLSHPGDSMGRLLGWAWQTDRHVFARALAIFHSALERAVRKRLDRRRW
jgi:hypothetical protein